MGRDEKMKLNSELAAVLEASVSKYLHYGNIKILDLSVGSVGRF
jgi:hypothetical protein